MNHKLISLAFVTIFFLSFISGAVNFNVRPMENNEKQVFRDFNYDVRYASDSSCNNIIFSGSASIRTDSSGEGFFGIGVPDFNNLTDAQYVCQIRNGMLVSSDSLSDGFFDKLISQSFQTKDISVDGDVDVNGDVTADYFIGDGSQLTNVGIGNESDPYWVANWSSYNSTWSQDLTYNSTQNDSINNYILYVNSTNGAGGSYDDSWINDTFYNTTQIGEINTSVTNYINENNDSVTNAIADVSAYDDSWINSTVDSKILTNNNSIINWITSTFSQIANLVDLVGNWSADKSSYYTSSQVDDLNSSVTNYINENNDSVTNAIAEGLSYSATGNTSQEMWDAIINGSVVLDNILNNGSYLNPAASDSFVANYSTFLTHITWAEAMNGTLFQTSDWNSTNSTYDENNVSLKNYVDWVNSTNTGVDTNETDRINNFAGQDCGEEAILGFFDNGTKVIRSLSPSS